MMSPSVQQNPPATYQTTLVAHLMRERLPWEDESDSSWLRLEARGLEVAVNPSSGIDLDTIKPPGNPLGED